MARFETRLAGLIRDADDIAKLVTGEPLAELVRKTFDLWGVDVANKLYYEVKPNHDSPYAVMGVRHNASTLVVKAAYRALAKSTHPDVGGTVEQWKKIQWAYEQIMIDRGLRP